MHAAVHTHVPDASFDGSLNHDLATYVLRWPYLSLSNIKRELECPVLGLR